MTNSLISEDTLNQHQAKSRQQSKASLDNSIVFHNLEDPTDKIETT